jgi:hypothetical protein
MVLLWVKRRSIMYPGHAAVIHRYATAFRSKAQKEKYFVIGQVARLGMVR